MKSKLIYSILLAIILAILVILTLTAARSRTADYLSEISSYSEEIDSIKYNLENDIIPENDLIEAESTISYVSSVADKALALNKIILPIMLILIIIIYESLYWKLNKNTKLIIIIPVTIMNTLILAALILSIISYADYKLFYSGKNSLYLIILLSVLLIITSYFSLIILSRNNTIRQNMNFAIANLKRFILQYLLSFLISIVYVILIGVIFVLSYINYSIIWPSIILVVIISIKEMQKYRLINSID